ncbi:hypothetical protein Tco_0956002 [Tanacetum coccineum]|uniref:Uncharacterized protein n=1 Tax=Tanacetum coccineum TaxID=301880 RepID=A0ABQ5E8U0_9ASTR
MDNIRAHQKALDDELEPTLQVVLDALKLTPFYKAFEITADVPEIYMQEFWVTVSRHHSSLRFKLNGKSLTLNVDNFKDMLKICPNSLHLTNQAMLESEVYKTYLAYATGEKIPKPKYGKNKADYESSPKKKTATTAKGKRLKTSAKAAKLSKKKQPAKTSKAKGLTVLSEVAVTEAEQMKLATKRSLIETLVAQVQMKELVVNQGDEEDDDEVGLNDNDDDNDDDEDNDDDDDDADIMMMAD